MENELFMNWLKTRKHKWEEEMRRRMAINRQTGSSLWIYDFPVSAEEGGVTIRFSNGATYSVENTPEFIDKVEGMIQDEIKCRKTFL